jgi:hypothetical protein
MSFEISESAFISHPRFPDSYFWMIEEFLEEPELARGMKHTPELSF